MNAVDCANTLKAGSTVGQRVAEKKLQTACLAAAVSTISKSAVLVDKTGMAGELPKCRKVLD